MLPAGCLTTRPGARPGPGRSRHTPEGAELPGDPPCIDDEYEWIRDDGTDIVDDIEGQGIMAWVTQGAVADRVNEKLTTSDVGVVACRRMLRESMAAVAEGRDPVAVVREPHTDAEATRQRLAKGPEQRRPAGSTRAGPAGRPFSGRACG